MAIDKRSPQVFYRMKYRRNIDATNVYEYDIEPNAPEGPGPTGSIPQLMHDLNDGSTGEHVLVGTGSLAHINPSNFIPPPSYPNNTRTLRLYRSGNFVTYPSSRDIQYLRSGLVSGTSPIDPTSTGHAIALYYTKYHFTDNSVSTAGYSGFIFARMQDDMTSCYFAIVEAQADGTSPNGQGSIRLYKGDVLSHDRIGNETDFNDKTDAVHLQSRTVKSSWIAQIIDSSSGDVNALRIALQVENQPTPGEVGIRVLVRTASPTADILNPTKGSWEEAISVIDASSPYTTGALGMGGITPSGTSYNSDMQALKYLFAGVELYGYTA